MKVKLIPVVVTAALTSVTTLATINYLQHKVPYFAAAKQIPAPVNYASYASVNNNTLPAGSVNFELAAAASVKAVVHIKTTTAARTVVASGNDVFSQLFGRQQYYIPSQIGSGSGVVISPDGYVVTNNHVVADANEVTVTFNDRYTATAKVIGTDPSTDIALLKVEGDKNLPYMEFGNSDDARLGQWVLAVGYPLTLDATVTAGIISAKGRSLGINKQNSSSIESFIQTDAAVNPGNSGGALVNTNGQLIGINSAIASPTGSYAGYSYAIPANIVRKAVNDLMKYGTVQRGYLGIQYLDDRNVSAEQLKELGINKSTEGVYVMNVLPNSGAAKAGIKKGDFVKQINGVAVNNQPELQGQIARYQPGDNVSILYSRGGVENTASVQLTNMNGTTDILKAGSMSKMLGASFRPLTDKERNSYNLDGGVLVADVGKGALAKTQMRKGFVITSVNDNAVGSVSDLQQSLASNSKLQIAGFYPGYQGMYYYSLNGVDAMAAEQ
ncbi:MAG: Do family serine endopeptidase [Flavipsychrobacter sp.]|nr:Do family serine endopeptidase [Flavipsychrobacter sp.]